MVSFFVIKDAPIVDVPVEENVFWTYRVATDVFPTPVLPNMTTLASSVASGGRSIANLLYDAVDEQTLLRCCRCVYVAM
ncbi:hypothetical protein BX666DRAFT_1893369 [Dichotomocladium elegans]|nr:hypothetical protein BX666DRAFT_1893369 [Dichotomocladium elegans]